MQLGEGARRGGDGRAQVTSGCGHEELGQADQLRDLDRPLGARIELVDGGIHSGDEDPGSHRDQRRWVSETIEVPGDLGDERSARGPRRG